MKKEFKKNKVNLNSAYKWGTGKEADSIRTMNSEELSDSVKQILKGMNLEKGVWVFGYGSLMWNPDIKLTEKRTGTVTGYRRSLCLKSFVYRGTPDYHGLVFGLDKGDSCQGMAYRIAENLGERNVCGNIYSYMGRSDYQKGGYFRSYICN